MHSSGTFSTLYIMSSSVLCMFSNRIIFEYSSYNHDFFYFGSLPDTTKKEKKKKIEKLYFFILNITTKSRIET